MPIDAPGATPKVMAALMVHGQVVCDAISASGRYAKLAAAKKALNLLQGLAVYEFKAKVGCACIKTEEDEEGGIARMGTAI